MLKAQGKQGYDIDDVEETASESAPIKGQTIERFHTLSLHCLPRVWRWRTATFRTNGWKRGEDVCGCMYDLFLWIPSVSSHTLSITPRIIRLQANYYWAAAADQTPVELDQVSSLNSLIMSRLSGSVRVSLFMYMWSGKLLDLLFFSPGLFTFSQWPNSYQTLHYETFTTEAIDPALLVVPEGCHARCPISSICTVL